ncbi:MAG: hypothetical protein WA005_17245 [Candidatus Binataceae bacterium]
MRGFAIAGLRDSAAGLAAGAIALAITAAGCAPLMALQLVPLGLQAAEAITVSAADTVSGQKGEKGDTGETGEKGQEDEQVSADRCDRLERAIPYVTEVKMTANGGVTLRQFTLSREDDKPQWTILYGSDTTPDGWRPESEITQLQFTPPLQIALKTEHARYLVFVPAYAGSTKEGEQLENFVTVFGPGDGTFQWRGRAYDYVVAKRLPCFANPS